MRTEVTRAVGARAGRTAPRARAGARRRARRRPGRRRPRAGRGRRALGRRHARRSRGVTLDPRPSARAWLDAHVNLETGVGVPGARRGRASACWPSSGSARSWSCWARPSSSTRCVHLTGTNGKTSVARMTAALLEAAGLSVGTYTSPHLARVNERMVWNGEPDRRRRRSTTCSWRWPTVEDLLPDAPSYFEILTAAALALVRRRRGRRRGGGGRAGRHLGRHQRGRRRRSRWSPT